jgi:TIR domain
MAYVTESQILHRTSRLAKSLLDEALQNADLLNGKTVFLSYSHADRGLLPGVIGLLEDFGAPAYVDFRDDELPPNASVETAQILRNRIENCPRFILAISQNTRRSRWTPWEIGLADGLKGLRRVALFPIVPTATSSPNIDQEYLDTYPFVEYIQLQGEERPDYCVRNPVNGRYWNLRYWLHKLA